MELKTEFDQGFWMRAPCAALTHVINATKREVTTFASNEAAADGYLPARGVWERYGVTSTSLYRWLADEKSDFPHPFYIGRFRYWKIADLLAWEAGRPSVGAPAGAARQRASRGQ